MRNQNAEFGVEDKHETADTILAALEEERVVRFELCNIGAKDNLGTGLRITELCDQYFEAFLSPSEAKALVEALQNFIKPLL